jgi:hypothetical protein
MSAGDSLGCGHAHICTTSRSILFAGITTNNVRASAGHFYNMPAADPLKHQRR